MGLKFCKDCQGLLILKEHKEGDYFECTNCGHIEIFTEDNGLSSKENVIPEEIKGEGASEDKNIFADYPNICKKCGHGFAQILDLGVFISDEDNLILLKCGKCGFSERIGRKTS